MKVRQIVLNSAESPPPRCHAPAFVTAVTAPGPLARNGHRAATGRSTNRFGATSPRGARFAAPEGMTKQTKRKGRSEETSGAPGGGTHQWQGQAVERASPVDEDSEVAASRAEGNAPLDVQQALERDQAARDPATFGLEEDDGTASADSPQDDAESEEEKRQAAVEDHAAGPPKHGPHGGL